jgi:serine/threonine protein kinase
VSKQLVFIRGLERGRVLPLEDADVLQLGCSQNLEVMCRLRDPEVARVHCEIKVEGDRVTVVDADTGRGTFLNGQPVKQQDLRPGDVIRIGGTELRFRDDDAAKAKTAADLSIAPGNPADTALMPAPPPAEKPQAPSAELLNKLVGKNFAQFKIEVQVGAGRWGRVFRAQDTRLNRTVALKVLRPEFGNNPEMLEHFRKALKLVVPLNHPNLVVHYAAGNAGPFCWISMEYVEGRSLTQVIRRASTSGLPHWKQALALAVDLGRAFQEVHKRGALHGHLTPQNILFRDQDKVTKIGDLMLGCALVKARRQPACLPSEAEEDLVYLAPEALEESQGSDVRTDIYGIGAAVYALLTGRPLFVGKSRDDAIHKIREIPPIKPVLYQPNVPDSFQQTLLKMLGKQPEDRHQSATELLADLQDTIAKHRSTVASLRPAGLGRAKEGSDSSGE